MEPANPRPLEGRRVVVTRAPEQAADLVRQLQQLGAEVLLLPTVSFAALPDPGPLTEAIRGIANFDWILFTSQNAVRFFWEHCRSLGAGKWVFTKDRTTGADWRALKPQVAVVGPATAEAAAKEPLGVDFVAREFRGEALARELGSRLAGKKVLLPRGDRASAELPAALRALGAEVTDVFAYRTSAPDSFAREVAQAIVRGNVDVVTFLSPSAFHHLAEHVGLETLRGIGSRVALAAIGPVTARAIRGAGLAVDIEAREATAASLVAAISDYFLQRLASGVKPK